LSRYQTLTNSWLVYLPHANSTIESAVTQSCRFT